MGLAAALTGARGTDMRAPALSVLPPLLALAAGCGGSPARSGAAAEPPGYLGPEIALADPPRGAVLVADGPAAVPVAGQACDRAHALAELRVDGQPLPVAAAGSCVPFSLQHPARLGLNVVHAEAANDAGQLGTLAQSFLWSPDYFGAAGAGDSMAESGVVIQLGPSFLDDGDRSTLNDVASVAQRELGKMDLDAAVGPVRLAQPDADGDGAIDTTRYGCVLYSQLNERTGFEARKAGPFTHGGVTVDRLQLAQGGVALRVTVARPRLPLAVTGYLDSGCLGVARLTVTGDASAAALVLEGQASVGLDAAGRPAVSFPAFAATLVDVGLDIDLGTLANWTGLGSAIGDAIAARFRDQVQAALRGAVQGELAAQLSGALAALAAFQASIALPAEVGGAELDVASALDALDFDAQRAVIGVAVQVVPRAPRPEHQAASPLGAMRMGGARPDATGLAASAIAVGVKDDLLNQLLHAAWLAGAFDRDLSALAAGYLPGARLALLAGLPPVLMPQEGAGPGLDLGWGDVAFELALPAPQGTARARGYLSAVLPIDRLDAGPAGIEIAFAPAAQAWVQVTDVTWGPGPVARESITAILEGAMRNLLPQALAQALRPLPLPRLDLRVLDPGLPALSLSLGAPRMARLGRYEFLAGSVDEAP